MNLERTKIIRALRNESDCSLAGIAGSNPAGSMDICLCECCVCQVEVSESG